MPSDRDQNPARATFPPLTKTNNDKYELSIKVSGTVTVPIQPPVAFVAPVGSYPPKPNGWPRHCFQLLLVASEYCATLQEFLAWSFPPEWESLKAQVARHAADLIHTSDVVPPPQPQVGQNDPRALEAYQIWAAFTHCYFCGTGRRDAVEAAARNADAWMQRLVGEHGWQKEKHVHTQAMKFVTDTCDGLEMHFSDLPKMSAGQWAISHPGSMDREIVKRRGLKGEAYLPQYPPRVTWDERNDRVRVQFKMCGFDSRQEVSGKCGVPDKQDGQSALGYLVVADVMQAFWEEIKHFDKADTNKHTAERFVKCMLLEECNLDGQSPYSIRLAGCALGWKLALGHVGNWVMAAKVSAAAALGAVAVAGIASQGPRQLRLPNLNLPQQALGQHAPLPPQQVPAGLQQPTVANPSQGLSTQLGMLGFTSNALATGTVAAHHSMSIEGFSLGSSCGPPAAASTGSKSCPYWAAGPTTRSFTVLSVPCSGASVGHLATAAGQSGACTSYQQHSTGGTAAAYVLPQQANSMAAVVAAAAAAERVAAPVAARPGPLVSAFMQQDGVALSAVLPKLTVTTALAQSNSASGTPMSPMATGAAALMGASFWRASGGIGYDGRLPAGAPTFGCPPVNQSCATAVGFGPAQLMSEAAAPDTPRPLSSASIQPYTPQRQEGHQHHPHHHQQHGGPRNLTSAVIEEGLGQLCSGYERLLGVMQADGTAGNLDSRLSRLVDAVGAAFREFFKGDVEVPSGFPGVVGGALAVQPAQEHCVQLQPLQRQIQPQPQPQPPTALQPAGQPMNPQPGGATQQGGPSLNSQPAPDVLQVSLSEEGSLGKLVRDLFGPDNVADVADGISLQCPSHQDQFQGQQSAPCGSQPMAAAPISDPVQPDAVDAYFGRHDISLIATPEREGPEPTSLLHIPRQQPEGHAGSAGTRGPSQIEHMPHPPASPLAFHGQQQQDGTRESLPCAPGITLVAVVTAATAGQVSTTESESDPPRQLGSAAPALTLVTVPDGTSVYEPELQEGAVAIARDGSGAAGDNGAVQLAQEPNTARAERHFVKRLADTSGRQAGRSLMVLPSTLRRSLDLGSAAQEDMLTSPTGDSGSPVHRVHRLASPLLDLMLLHHNGSNLSRMSSMSIDHGDGDHRWVHCSDMAISPNNSLQPIDEFSLVASSSGQWPTEEAGAPARLVVGLQAGSAAPPPEEPEVRTGVPA